MNIQKGNSGPGGSSNDAKPTASSCGQSNSVDEPVKIYKLGEKGSGIRLQGAVQDFHRLRKQCLLTGKLFEDPEFPANDCSLFASKKPIVYREEIEWLRPPAIGANPQFYVEGSSRFDVEQGHFGNCWMIASVANLAMHPKLLYHVVPRDQSFQKDYAGIFHFRFWQFGKWVEVVIDDRLPMYNEKLIGMHSNQKNEYWSSLLEKAYAKLHGYWDALSGGFNSEALEDFTGGIAQLYNTQKPPADLFDILLEAEKRNSLLGCGILLSDSWEIEMIKGILGLVSLHAYTITKVMYIDGGILNQSEKIPLLRVRNPWGSYEWKGPWSDESFEWKSIPEDKKKELGLVSKDDGEFWIPFKYWKDFFTFVEICYLDPSSMVTENDDCDGIIWEANSIEGEWVRGVTAGGGQNLNKFKYNPQYLITLEEESTVIVALMQKNRRTQRPEGVDYLHIAFCIYKLPEGSKSETPKPLDTNFFENNSALRIYDFLNAERPFQDSSDTYHRESGCRIKLQPGAYCIIPYLGDKNEEGEFLLRVFSEKPNNLEEYDDQVGLCEPDNTVLKQTDVDVDEVELRSVFRKLAGDDWEFDWKENKEILDCKLREELSNGGFSDDACRSMVALLDADFSGKLGYQEFKTFWKNVKILKATYKIYDVNNDGYLKLLTLKQALKTAGFRLDRQTLNLLSRRYGTADGYIKFEDFFMCALRLAKIIDGFKEHASAETNTATLTMSEWINTTLKSG